MIPTYSRGKHLVRLSNVSRLSTFIPSNNPTRSKSKFNITPASRHISSNNLQKSPFEESVVRTRPECSNNSILQCVENTTFNNENGDIEDDQTYYFSNKKRRRIRNWVETCEGERSCM